MAYPARVKLTMCGSVKHGDLKKLQLRLIMDAVAFFDENKANTYTEKTNEDDSPNAISSAIEPALSLTSF